MAQLRRLREKFPDELVVIGVHSAKFTSEGETENIRQAVMRHGIEHPVVNVEGKLYVADTENHAVRVIHLKDGRVQTVAGTGQKAHGRYALVAPDKTPLRSPWAVLPLEEYLLIAMAGSHQVWVLIQEQQLGPFAGDGQEALRDGPVAQSSFNQPSDLDLGLGYLFVADPEASAIRAISLNENPKTQTLVGQGLFDWGDQDGATTEALLQHPVGLAYANNLIYIADTYNNKIKVLDPFVGQVMTLIGDGKPGLRDGSFEHARLFEPEGLRVSGSLLYIADTNNHQIRVADLNQRQLHTFSLRGIERLPVAKLPDDHVLKLDAVQVSPGKVRFALEVQLPEGYKRNPDVSARLRIGEEPVQRDFQFEADQEITWTLDLGADQNLPLDLTLYYCQSEASQLCLIHAQRLVLPVRVVSSGEHQVRIPYPVEAAA